MTLTRWKILAATVLLGALALPQSTCAGYRAPNGTFVAAVPRDVPPAGYEPTVHRDYAFDDFQVTDPGSWFQVAIFLWPLPLLILAARSRSARVRAYIRVLDPVLALCAGYLVWFSASLFAEPAVGAYVAVGALTVYFAASAVDLWRVWRARRAPVERRLTSA